MHMRLLLRSILNAFRFDKVREADNVADAFKLLQRGTVDFAILDWHMIPMDGLDFIRLVRTAKDSPNPYLPIIMLTGHTELERVMEARDAGANEVMAKPVSPRALMSRIVSIIEHPRPFVRSNRYFGPDRRRKDIGAPHGVAERRADWAGNNDDVIELSI